MLQKFCTILIALVPWLEAAEQRTWTDKQGRTIEASMVGLREEVVLLSMKDGREIPYPLAKLSDADAAWARDNGAAIPNREETKSDANFDNPWPETIRYVDDPEIEVIKEDADEGRFVYESKHYRYTCDVRLSKTVVKGFAVMFEATHLFCRTVPLGIDGGEKTDGKFQIYLYEEFDDYVKAGGPPSSAGVFIGGKNCVMVPLTSLGVRPVGSGYMFDRDKANKTLPHEITHQLTPDSYFRAGSRGWFTEGIADYVAVTPYRSGAYNIRGNKDDISEYAIGYGKEGNGGRALGSRVVLPPLKDFMLQSYDQFLSRSSVNYGVSLLITFYFLQIDGNGDAANLKKFLRLMREGNSGEKALEALRAGRSFADLEEAIAKAWKREGIELVFSAEQKLSDAE